LEANTPAGQATCDMYGEQIQDYVSSTQPWGRTFFGLVPAEQREEIYTTKVQPAIDGIGELLGGQLQKNGNGYLVGSKLTWVDIFLAEFVDKIVGHTKPDVLARYPLIEAHYKKIFSLPAISKYAKERPSYPY
ncbi:GST-36 protein, partial [Aphelenchoides avenae]